MAIFVKGLSTDATSSSSRSRPKSISPPPSTSVALRQGTGRPPWLSSLRYVGRSHKFKFKKTKKIIKENGKGRDGNGESNGRSRQATEARSLPRTLHGLARSASLRFEFSEAFDSNLPETHTLSNTYTNSLGITIITCWAWAWRVHAWHVRHVVWIGSERLSRRVAWGREQQACKCKQSARAA